MLLYTDGSFLQALEGDEAVVRDLYATIAGDDRHQQVTLIIEFPVETRSFSDWSMGLAILNPEDEGQASGVKRFDHALDGLLDPEGILEFMRDFASRM
jgi:hypothetical protein